VVLVEYPTRYPFNDAGDSGEEVAAIKMVDNGPRLWPLKNLTGNICQ
jgi:hypothetical protein